MNLYRHKNIYTPLQRIGIGTFIFLFAILSGTVSFWIEHLTIENNFRQKGLEATRLINQRITNIETILVSLAGLYQSDDELSSAEQSAFSQELLKAYPFIKAIMFAEWIPSDRIDLFEMRMKKEGYINYSVRTSSTTNKLLSETNHLPISFIEPMTPLSANWLGYDPLSEIEIYDKINESISNGNTTVIGPILLKKSSQPTYIALKPIYLGRYPPNSIVERKEMFSGMAALQIDISQFIAGISQQISNNNIEMTLSETRPKSDLVTEADILSTGYSHVFSNGYRKVLFNDTIDIHGHTFYLSAEKSITASDVSGWRVTVLWFSSLLIILLIISVHWNRKAAQIQKAEADAILDAENARFKNIVDTAFDAVITADTNGKIVSWNQRSCELFGYTEAEAIGQYLFRLILSDESYVKYSNKIQSALDLNEVPARNVQFEATGKDKKLNLFTLELAISHTHKDNNSILSVFARDISEKKLRDEKIRYLAYHDALTGLPNRQAFKEHVSKAIEHAKRSQKTGAILYLDLDEFKRINDTLGHELGDLLIKNISSKLYDHLRTTDIIARQVDDDIENNNRTIARLGGDEFTVLLEDLESPEAAGLITRRIYNAISGIYNLDGHEVFITPSTGIAIFPDDGDNVEELLKNADTAMYHAKSLGKNNFQFYTDKMNALMASRLKLEGKLRNALTNNEFKLNYQAQIDLETGQTVSAEALLRWQQPELGNVPPYEFIPIAEDTGLIIELGEWVLNEACRQNREWQDAGYEPIKISVNLSAIQFLQGNLLEVIKNILGKNQLKPEYLELEITESTLMSNIEDTIKTLIEIKKLGVSIAIDDFGTGYSSLSYLKRLPLDILKIDRSFIKDMPEDGDDTAITSAIIAMAHQLQLRVVAEGVETETQMNILREFGCEIGQGYYYCRPKPADEFEQHISTPDQAKTANIS